MRSFVVGLAIAVIFFAASALQAETPTFSELFEDQGTINRLPVTFPADIGTVFVSADDSNIGPDVSCDPLSDLAMYVDSQVNRPPFEIRFMHTHPDDPDTHEIGERETFKLKMGAEEVDRYGPTVGYESKHGFRFFVVQFGPAAEGSVDADRFGELYIHGEPSGIRFGNIFDSVCSGPDRMDAQVFVKFEMLGDDGIYFVTLKSNAPYPQRETFGPFQIPDVVLEEGYGSCLILGPSGSGRIMADGATCLSSSLTSCCQLTMRR